MKKELEKERKLEEALKSMQEDKEAIKIKKHEKSRSVQVNREHAIKTREIELKK